MKKNTLKRYNSRYHCLIDRKPVLIKNIEKSLLSKEIIKISCYENYSKKKYFVFLKLKKAKVVFFLTNNKFILGPFYMATNRLYIFWNHKQDGLKKKEGKKC